MSQGAQIDYDALAKQYGAVSSTPASAGIDYDALAKQYGATSSVAPSEKTVAPQGPTPAQQAYRQATAAGPYPPAGAAESAIGTQMGRVRPMAMESAKTIGEGAAAFGAGLGGAEVLGPAASVAGPALKWARNNAAALYWLSKAADALGLHPARLFHAVDGLFEGNQ